MIDPNAPLRAITVMHPYAWALGLGWKPTENRASITTYRGPVAIHAGCRWVTEGAADPLILAAVKAHRDANGGTSPDEPPLSPSDAEFRSAGKILAVRVLVDCHRATVDDQGDVTCCTDPWALARYGGRPVRAHIVWGSTWVLDRPVPVVGRQGWWFVPDAVRRAVYEQMPVGQP